MVSREPILLIAAADRREFAAFREHGWRWRKVESGLDWCAEATSPGGEALLVANGPGRARAAEAVRRARQLHPLRAVVSTGFCGALDPNLRAGDIFLARKVIQFQDGLEYPGRLPAGGARKTAKTGVLLTIDRVAQTVEEKRALRARGPDAVDMEASAVAAVAGEWALPFYCVRAVSDEAARGLALDFNAARGPDGRFSGVRILLQAALRPSAWKDLYDLRRGARAASAALARFLSSAEFPDAASRPVEAAVRK